MQELFEREKKQPGQHPHEPQSQTRGGGCADVDGGRVEEGEDVAGGGIGVEKGGMGEGDFDV